jgi:hypothetical protein
MATPVEEFQTAVGVGDVERARGLLSGHAEVRTAVNDPIAAFGSRPIAVARKNLPVLDVMLEFGADLKQPAFNPRHLTRRRVCSQTKHASRRGARSSRPDLAGRGGTTARSDSC